MGNISKVGEICQSTYNLDEADAIMCFTVPGVPFSAFFTFTLDNWKMKPDRRNSVYVMK